MDTAAFQTPVALFAFKRPDTTRRVFEAISRIRPAKLLLVADGPRPDRSGEAEACAQVRDIVSRVDWPCEVLRNFSETNLGCRERMISGLNWVFSQVEEAIILEDDCLPDPSFFPFCEELLDRYRSNTDIAYISGSNVVGKYMPVDDDSYFFSRIGGIWGWASWRSRWQRYDRHLSDWPELKAKGRLAEIFDESKAVKFWTSVFDAFYEDRGPDTWDSQWVYTYFKNNLITIVPRVNLIENIGFGEGATHTPEADPKFMIRAASIEFPLKHPCSFIPLRSLDRHRVRDMFPPAMPYRVLNKLRRIAKQSFGRRKVS